MMKRPFFFFVKKSLLFWTYAAVMTMTRIHRTQGAASLDDAIAQELDRHEGVGLTAWTVNANGTLCSVGVAGERILGSGEPLETTGDSRHHTGSITKSMTSTLLAILLEHNTIPDERGWDSTLVSLVPDIATGTSYEDVTLRQLVSHLAGIPSRMAINLFHYTVDEHNDMRSLRKSVASYILNNSPLHTPGSAYHYTNFGYIVAGHIVEEYTSMTWEEALQEYMFSPLGIDLGDDPLDYTGPPDNGVDPWGHWGDDQTPCNPSSSTFACDNPAVLGPAGTFSGPVAAMAAYFAWHIRCHNGDIPEDDPSADLLSQESCQEIHQPADSSIRNYGYGWICTERQWANGPTCTHTGSNNLHYYIVWLGFDINTAIVGYANGGRRSDSADFRMVDAAILAAIYGDKQCDARIPSSIYIDSSSSSSSPSPEPTCKPIMAGCESHFECCSGRCILDHCRYNSLPWPSKQKMSTGRGGAAGGNRRLRGGFSKARVKGVKRLD